MPRVVKSDANREPFDESKLRAGMLKALEKRPVASDAVDAAVAHVCHKLRTLGEREVPARLIGELVMDELHRLDEVAFVRFASVYRSFQDVEAFREEIERLRQRRAEERRGSAARSLVGHRPVALAGVARVAGGGSVVHDAGTRAGASRDLFDTTEPGRGLRAGARRPRRRRGPPSSHRRPARGGARARGSRRGGPWRDRVRESRALLAFRSHSAVHAGAAHGRGSARRVLAS